MGFNGGSTINSYKVYVNATGAFEPVFEQTNVVDLDYTLTAQVIGEPFTGKFYAFKVSAINVVGESAFSDEVVLITALKPLAATNLAKLTADVSQITFSWTAADAQGIGILGYKVYWNNGNGAANTLLKADLGVVTQFSTSPLVADLNDGA